MTSYLSRGATLLSHLQKNYFSDLVPVIRLSYKNCAGGYYILHCVLCNECFIHVMEIQSSSFYLPFHIRNHLTDPNEI
jgi:hypothetical protein